MTTSRLHKHEKLGITFAQLGALLGTRALIAEGYMKHTTTTSYLPVDTVHYINMGVGHCSIGECGSVGCIGGTMALLLGVVGPDRVVGKPYTFSTFMDHHATLRPLFHPPGHRDYGKITKTQMLQAIDNFLKDGKPRWEKILPKRKKR